MIVAGLLALAVFPGRFNAIAMPKATAVNVCIVAPLPLLGAKERAESRVLAKCLLDGTSEYTKRSIRQLTLGSGQMLRCTAMPDHIRLQLGFAPQDLSLGLHVVRSLIEEANLTQESMNAAINALAFVKQDYWSLALAPEIADYEQVKPRSVVEMYAWTFKPDRISVSVSGPTDASTVEDMWARIWEDWTPKRVLSPLPGQPPEKGVTPSGDPITTVELAGPEFSGKDPKLPERLLAIFALGVGKDSAVWHALREKEAISYRQEALLWPTSEGFRPRIIFAARPGDGESALPEKARNALLSEVATWDSSARSRALAMAEGVYVRGLALNPLQFQEQGRIGIRQSDITFMDAYWPIKTGKEWSPTDLLEAMRGVSLDQMRSAAAEMLKGSIPRVIPGLR